MNENDRTDDILLWTRLVLSLAQLVVALSVIGLIVAPPLTNGLNRLKTEIWGQSITLEATVTDRQGNPVPNVTVTVVHDDGTPYKDSVGNPARSVTDENGRCKIKATVKGTYRLEFHLNKTKIRRSDKNMVDFSEWSQDPYILFIVFLVVILTATFISGIFFLWNDKKTKKIIGGLLEAVCFISVMALAMTIGLDKAQRPTFGEALATSYGYESVRCDGDGDVTDGDTPCVAYSNHGRKRQVITVVGDSEKNTVRVYDSQGNLVKPVLMKAPSKKD